MDECKHGDVSLNLDTLGGCLRELNLGATVPAQSIDYHPIDIDYAPLPGSTALAAPRRHAVTARYGQALRAHVNGAIAHRVPDVLLWRGHGGLVDKSAKTQLATGDADSENRPPDVWNPRSYRACTAMGIYPRGGGKTDQALISGEDIADADNFPIMPTTLWFSESCYGAWEVSFAKRVISRGCTHFIGSRRSWHGHEARDFLKVLMNAWQKLSFAPVQLEPCFRAVAVNRRGAYPVMYRAAVNDPYNDYTMIHAPPVGLGGSYRHGHLPMSVGERVSIDLI